MKVIIYDAKSSYNGIPRPDHIPLGNNIFIFYTFLNAFQICLKRNMKFFMKPIGRANF